MFDATGLARRLLRRLAAPRPQAGETDPGTPAAADGNHAVAVTEAWVSDAAAVGSSFPVAAAGRAFLREAAAEATNLLGRPVEAVEATSPRGALAAAIGLAEAGRRAAAFLDGPDLATAQDLLARAVERRLPLVVHLVCRSGAGSGGALASGHEALALASASGALTLAAANVQEAVDFTLIGRRVAEEALLPVVVAMDCAETALSTQDVLLPSARLVRRFLGDPGERIHSATPAQELLFGRHRRRVPRGHDPERPTMTGAAQGPEVAGAAALGRRIYFDRDLAASFEAACARFAELTGRRPAGVTAHRADGAKVVLVAVGAMIETAEAVAERLREGGVAAGVVGPRCLAPLDAGRITEWASGARAVAVLERGAPSANGDGPLASRLRAALGQAWENSRLGGAVHAGLPAVGERKMPRLVSVAAGLGGLPVAAADLELLVRELLEGGRSPIFLGVDPLPSTSSHPKRQILLDALRRDYPEAAELGLSAREAGPDLRPPGAVTFVIAARGGESVSGLAQEAALLLHRALGGHLRSRPRVSWDPWSTAERVTWSKEPLRDPGDKVPVEVVLWVSPGRPPAAELAGSLADGGAVLLTAEPGAAAGKVWKTLPRPLRRAVADRGVELFGIPPASGAPASTSRERLLGALLGILEARGVVTVPHRKLLDARRDTLAEAGVLAEQRQGYLDEFTIGLDGVTQLMPPGPAVLASLDEERAVSDEVPPEVRRLGRSDTRLDSLSRFWDQVGLLYRDGETAEIGPDPYLAATTVPPLAAAFRSFAAERIVLPAFDPAPCTGCGDCWTACPHGALEPAVLGAEGLLDAAMARVAAAGVSVDALRMVKGRLAGRLSKEMAGEDGAAAGPVLDRAFAAVMAKMPLPEERKAAVETAFQAIRDELAELPLARTATFFDVPEAATSGSGELFLLAVDADACKGCGLCVAACEPGALLAEADTAERTAAARTLARRVAELPAPSPATLERARSSAEVGPLAGALLDPAARGWMTGGDGSEAGSGEALAARRVLGAAAFHLAPRRAAYREEIRDLRERLAAEIQSLLAGALPASDLDALARGLDAVERPDADLAEITARVETAFESDRVDVVRLRRLVAVAREVADLQAHLESGESGMGRAPYGVVVGPGSNLTWAGAFPWNPFAVPVTVDSCGETAALARGLAAGAMQATVEEARLLRRARLELERPSEAGRGETEAFRFADLTPEERRACPPLFVLVSEDAVLGAGADLAGLLDLLTTDLPVKLLLLAGADPALPTRVDAGLLALTGRQRRGGDATVAQSSIAAPAQLEAAVRAMVEADLPALLRIHAPSPRRGGFAADATLAQARESLASGFVPLFLAPADARGLDLSGNPEVTDELLEALPPAHRAGWEWLRRLAAGEKAPPDEAPAVAAGDLAALEERHRAEVAHLTAQYEARLAKLAAEIRGELARKVRGRLLELALRGQAAAEEEGAEVIS